MVKDKYISSYSHGYFTNNNFLVLKLILYVSISLKLVCVGLCETLLINVLSVLNQCSFADYI